VASLWTIKWLSASTSGGCGLLLPKERAAMLFPLQQFLLSLSLSPPLPSFFVFHSLSLSHSLSFSLSLSLCLRNVLTHVRVCLINAFAIKKFKIPYHVNIVKNKSKSFVEISFLFQFITVKFMFIFCKIQLIF